MMSSSEGLETQLMMKIAEQANELAKFNVELQESRAVMDKIENRNIAISEGCGGLSRETQRKKIEKEYRDKFLALEKQLALSHSRLNENSKARNQQVVELEKITREYKFFKSQCVDLQKESLSLKTQIVTKDKMIKKLKSNAHEDPEPIRQELEKANRDLDHVFAENEELKLKVRVLEDALEFRADEIGLAGHADLLSKIAHFRGEVHALKNDLQSKHVKLETVLHESLAEREKNEQLHENVTTMQQRLAEAKHDLTRMQDATDLLEQLKAAETERDVLVDFIQTDLKKSSAVSGQLEATEAELEAERKARAAAEKKLQQVTADVNHKVQQLATLQESIQALTTQVEEARRVRNSLEMELDEARISLERKSIEADELFKMQTSLLTQSQHKDSSREGLEKNIRELSAKCHDLELQMTYLRKDNDMLGQKSSRSQEEVHRLTQQLEEVTPKLMRLEPEYTRLAEEHSVWASQKENHAKDLREYKLACATLDELNYGLQSLSSGLEGAGEESSGRSAEQYTLSQKHVMWCGIPALRRLSAPLYDQIRAMFQDLRKVEKDLNDCRGNYEVDVDELKETLQSNKRDLDQKEAIVQASKSQIEKLTSRLEESDAECSKRREVSAVLDNIRLVLKSSASRTNRTPNKSHRTLSSSGGARSRFNLEDRYDDLQQPMDMDVSVDDDINLYDLADSGVKRKGHARYHRNVEEDCDDVDKVELEAEVLDSDLPAAVSRALVRNLDSVTRVQACEQELTHLRSLSSSLQREKSILLAENEGLKQASRCFHQLTESREHEHSTSERNAHCSLNQAAELTERQNALIAKLEDKLTEFRRKMLLKASQVTSLQQREGLLQKRLYQSVTSYARMKNIKVAISEESALPELVKVVSSLLQESIRDFQDREFLSIPTVPHADNEPRQHQHFIDHHHVGGAGGENQNFNDSNYSRTSRGDQQSKQYHSHQQGHHDNNNNGDDDDLWEPACSSPKRRAPQPPR